MTHSSAALSAQSLAASLAPKSQGQEMAPRVQLLARSSAALQVQLLQITVTTEVLTPDDHPASTTDSIGTGAIIMDTAEAMAAMPTMMDIMAGILTDHFPAAGLAVVEVDLALVAGVAIPSGDATRS